MGFATVFFECRIWMLLCHGPFFQSELPLASLPRLRGEPRRALAFSIPHLQDFRSLLPRSRSARVMWRPWSFYHFTLLRIARICKLKFDLKVSPSGACVFLPLPCLLTDPEKQCQM